MKQTLRLITLWMLLLTSLSSSAPIMAINARDIPHAGLFPVYAKGKWGFIDRRGRLVIAPIYQSADYFSEGLAAVKIGDRYGYIDATGQSVIAPRFVSAFAFREGLAWVEGEQAGFIDKSGRIVVQAPPNTYCREFRGGLAKTTPAMPRFNDPSPDTKIGFIDHSGQYAIKPQFDQAWDFEEGLAAVRLNGRWGFIDTTGRVVVPFQYDQASYFSEGLAAVTAKGRAFFIDKNGRRALRGDFEEASGFREGLTSVRIGGKWGFVDKRGQIVIAPQFEQVASFFNGRTAVMINRKYGYIDRRGRLIVPPRYGYAHFFLGELAGVAFQEQSDGSGIGYLNRSGGVVWQPRSPIGKVRPLTALNE